MLPRRLLLGPTGSDKTTLLQQRYRALVQAGARTDQILVLVAGAAQAHAWRQALDLPAAGPLHIASYFGFVQRELDLYWDRVQPQLPPGVPAARPLFLNVETAHYVMRQVVDGLRAEGAFQKVTAGPQRLAVLLASNVWTVATAGGVPHTEIAARLAGARGGEDRELYQQVQEAVARYRDLLLQARALDYGLALEVYHQYLLPDLVYRRDLAQRFCHLLVDDLDEAVPRQVAFLQEVLPWVQTAWVAYSPDGGHSRFMGARPELALAALSRLLPVEELGPCRTAPPELCALGDALASRILGDKSARVPVGPIATATGGPDMATGGQGTPATARPAAPAAPTAASGTRTAVPPPPPLPRVERIAAGLYGEMAAEIGQRVADLIRSGVPPAEIAIIAPQVDKVLLHQVEAALRPLGCRAEDMGRTRRLLDDPFARALLAVVLLVHPEWAADLPAPPAGLLAGALAVLLDLDPVRASLLAGAVAQAGDLPDLDEAGLRRRVGFRAGELYDGLVAWVRAARAQDQPVDELVAAAASELLAPLAEGRTQLVPARQLVQSAQRIQALMARLAQAGWQRPAGRAFVELLLAGTIAADPLDPPGTFPTGSTPQGAPDTASPAAPSPTAAPQAGSPSAAPPASPAAPTGAPDGSPAAPGAVAVATPYAWLASRRTARWQIWADVTSDLWFRSDVKEITNPHALAPDWPPGEIWTDSRQARARRENAARTVRALLRRCREGLVVAECAMSAWGYEQEGGIAAALEEVLPVAATR